MEKRAQKLSSLAMHDLTEADRLFLRAFEAESALRCANFEQELRVELQHRYDLLALEREAEQLAREAQALRDPWWLRALRWLSRRIASGHGA
jgi:hypothetical protein